MVYAYAHASSLGFVFSLSALGNLVNIFTADSSRRALIARVAALRQRATVVAAARLRFRNEEVIYMEDPR